MYTSHVSTVGLPVNPVTPEGVIFVAQWVFLLLICYGVITLAFLLVTFFLRCLWWLLKVGVALACFGLILNDHSVDIKTMVFRLLSLGCVCLLLSIRPWKAAKIVHLDEKVKILENRVREMDRWKRKCTILSCCGILCFGIFVVFVFCTVISNSKKLWVLFSLKGFWNFRDEKLSVVLGSKGKEILLKTWGSIYPTLDIGPLNTLWDDRCYYIDEKW